VEEMSLSLFQPLRSKETTAETHKIMSATGFRCQFCPSHLATTNKLADHQSAVHGKEPAG